MMRGMNAAVIGLAIAALCAAGCRTQKKSPAPPPPQPQMVEVSFTLGRIVRINSEHGYVVMQCVSLPSLGEAATVWREDQAVGRLLVNGPLRPPFAVADILQGEPMAGDHVRVTRIRPAETKDGGAQ